MLQDGESVIITENNVNSKENACGAMQNNQQNIHQVRSDPNEVD
jgi:hypothetical protein